jgi:small-conductance mechanosensitive channel
MLTVADIGKQNKIMKYFLDSGDFSDAGKRAGLAALSSFQTWAMTIWNFEVFVVDKSPITLGKLFLALVLFIVGIRLSRRLATKLLRKLLSGKHMDPGAAAAFETISFYALVVLWAVISLQFVRIPLTIFTLAGGALAIGVGFGRQNIVKNFFSGLILLLERPILVGDLIQYNQTIGTVTKIETRSTVITTPEHLEVVVPNGHLIENVVTNWTLPSTKMRRKVTVGVAYGSPIRDVSQITLAQAEKHNLVLKDPAPDVLFTQFGESSLDFALRFWLNVGGGEGPKIESDLRHMIDGAFRDAGIVIAFPQRDINMSTVQPLKVEIVNPDTGSQPITNTEKPLTV